MKKLLPFTAVFVYLITLSCNNKTKNTTENSKLIEEQLETRYEKLLSYQVDSTGIS